MVTKKRNIRPENYYHVYNRAVSRNKLFINEEDYYFWQKKACELRELTKVSILAWSYLPTHYHYLLKEPDYSTIQSCQFKGPVESSISQFISRIENSYTKYLHQKYDHSGVIFQGVYKSINIDNDEYLQYLIYYINLNPLKHRIVDNIDDWSASSHHDYLNQTKNKIVDNDDLISFDDYKLNYNEYLSNYKKLQNKIMKYLP